MTKVARVSNGKFKVNAVLLNKLFACDQIDMIIVTHIAKPDLNADKGQDVQRSVDGVCIVRADAISLDITSIADPIWFEITINAPPHYLDKFGASVRVALDLGDANFVAFDPDMLENYGFDPDSFETVTLESLLPPSTPVDPAKVRAPDGTALQELFTLAVEERITVSQIVQFLRAQQTAGTLAIEIAALEKR